MLTKQDTKTTAEGGTKNNEEKNNRQNYNISWDREYKMYYWKPS